MPARRVFVDRISEGVAEVSGERARHLSRVVRLRPGEVVEVSDFARVFRAEANQVGPNSVMFALLEEVSPTRPVCEIELWIPIIKFPRLEWVIEKAVELGAAKIGLLAAERSDVRLIEAVPKRIDRWRRLAEEAAPQSRRLAPPAIVGPVPLEDISSTESRYLLDFEAPALKSAIRPSERAVLAVGPEGGWSELEREQASETGWTTATLGSTVLRAETAAVAGLAALSHLLEP